MNDGFVPGTRPDRLAAGDGPLTGLRLSVKDVIDVAGVPTGAGNPTWLATHPVPTTDAASVAALRRAGATVVGKTHTDELAYSLFGSNAHYGTPVNPAAPGRLPGGSSSGAASTVAAGLADLALGTDTAGSIRVPASWCGLFGLRPTYQRTSRQGVVPLAPSFDVPGLLARDLATLRAGAACLLTGEPSGTGVHRMATVPWMWDPLPRKAFASALAELAGRFSLVELDLPPTPLDAFVVSQGRQAWNCHGQWITLHQPVFGPHIGARFATAARLGDDAVARAERELAAYRLLLHAAVADTVLVLPSTPIPAPLAGQPLDADTRGTMMRLTTIASIGGLPALSVPVGRMHGLPIGLTLVGAPGSDESLLEVGALLKSRASPAPSTS